MTRRVAVVAHTHWDREWYAPFSAFRLRLVELLDEFLTQLEKNPGYRHFLLDGQMAVVDDYLAMRPEAETRLRQLATSGRLSAGPWYVLMDEFAVSGETMVRNLQLGLERAASFGGAMPVGYLPDMFGHVGQMPQLLCSAGLEHAVVWRGVPGHLSRTGFWWRSPDGSTVRAEYLPVGYSNGAHLPADADAVVRRIRAHEAEISSFLRSEGDPILLLAGTDHEVPQPWLPEVLAQANADQKDLEFDLTSLGAYLAVASTEALPSWSGEMRSGARANLLMGVHSNRVDIKAAAARAERGIERLAEPLAALWIPPGSWPQAALDAAWRELILNSAHDSICACGIDEVGTAVLHRYSEAAAIGESLTARALTWAGAQMGATGVVIVNPTAVARSGLVEFDIAGDAAPGGAQVVDRRPAATTQREGTGADLARILGELSDEGWLRDGRGSWSEVTSTPEQVTLRIVSDPSEPASPDQASVMAEAWAQAGAHRDSPLAVVVERRPTLRIVVRTPEVPGYGWAAFEADTPSVAPVTGAHNWLDNGLVRLAVSPANGTFSINGLAGLDRLVDSGDAGDTYNYSAPEVDEVIDRPESVTVEALEAGPARGRLRVTRTYRWPAAVVSGRRVGAKAVTVETDLEMRAGERIVRLTARFDNPSRDHRLRTVFPLPARTDHSIAECAFGTVKRSLYAEGGPHEPALATYPSRRFVSASGVTVTHEGLLEYEVIDDGGSLALTLLRATGMLSRSAPAARPNSAGPAYPVSGPQLIGPVEVRYAVAVTDEDPYRVADDAWVPLLSTRAAATGQLPSRGSLLQIDGAEVASLRRRRDATEVRVFNPGGDTTNVHIAGRRGWLMDLRDQPLEAWDETFVLRPWGIATARLDDDAS